MRIYLFFCQIVKFYAFPEIFRLFGVGRITSQVTSLELYNMEIYIKGQLHLPWTKYQFIPFIS